MDINILKAIYTTLNQVEIKGEQNIAYMYGVMETLKNTIVEAETTLKKQEEVRQ